MDSVEQDQEALLQHCHPNTEIGAQLGRVLVCYSILQPKVTNRIVEAWVFPFLKSFLHLPRLSASVLAVLRHCPFWLGAELGWCVYLKWHTDTEASDLPHVLSHQVPKFLSLIVSHLLGHFTLVQPLGFVHLMLVLWFLQGWWCTVSRMSTLQ